MPGNTAFSVFFPDAKIHGFAYLIACCLPFRLGLSINSRRSNALIKKLCFSLLEVIVATILVLAAFKGHLIAADSPKVLDLSSHPLVNKKSIGDLPDIRKRTWLRTLVTSSKTDFFFHHGQPKGLHAEPLLPYEDFLNQKKPKHNCHTG
jgi:hypothetical protein